MRGLNALALLLLSAICISIPLASAYTPSTSTVASNYLLIELPTSVPSNASLGNCVVEVLRMINMLSINGSLKAFWLLDSVTVNGVEVAPGSILIEENGAANRVESLARSCGLEVMHLSRAPLARAVIIRPPRIAVLNPGFQPTLLMVLKYLGFNYSLISNSSITDLLKGRYDLLILPPGSGTQLCRELGPGGSRIVAEFVANGGGLIGICAGAYAPVKGYNEPTSWLQIVALRVRNYPLWALGGGIVYLRVVAPNNPVMYGFRGVIKAIYWNGPVLEPYNLDNHTTLGIEASRPQPLAIYLYPSNDSQEFTPGWGKLKWSYVYRVMKGGYAIVYARYGLGKIVLFAVHPEIVVGPEDTPKAVLKSRYNWRMLWQAIYFVSGERVLLGKIVGVWVWPSALRHVYSEVLKEMYGSSRELTLDEKRRAFVKACDIFAEELKSYGITDVFLQVKLLSGTLIYPSKVGSKYGVPNPYPAEPYNITNVVEVCAEELHKHGIRLHAWIIVWYDEFWGHRAPMYHCGKWVSKTKYVPPYPVTSRVDLFYKPYREYIAELARELVSMGVDGIQLDYIRWPHAVYSFGPLDFEIAREHGIDLQHVERIVIETFYGMPNESKSADPELLFKLLEQGKDRDVVKWFELRRAVVDDIIERVAEAVKQANPHAILSAALLPDAVFKVVTYEVKDALTGRTVYGRVPGSVWQLAMYGQVYTDFAKLGYWLVPMAYHRAYGRSVSWVGEVAKYFASIAHKYGVRAVIGIQAYGGVTYSELLEAEKLALENGADGYCIFNVHSFLPMAYSAVLSSYRGKILELIRMTSLVADIARSVNSTRILSELESVVSDLKAVLSERPWMWMNPATVYSHALERVLDAIKELSKIIVSRIEAVLKEALRKSPAASSLVYAVNASIAQLCRQIAYSKSVADAYAALKKLLDESARARAMLQAIAVAKPRTVTIVYTPRTSVVTVTVVKPTTVVVRRITTTTVIKQLPVRTVSTVVTVSKIVTFRTTVTYLQKPTSTVTRTITVARGGGATALALSTAAIVLAIAAIVVSALYTRRSAVS